MVYLFLADGFEEAEALIPIDLLRRAGIKVKTVGVGSATPTGSHKVTVISEISEETFFPDDDVEAVVLPGGSTGVRNLENSETVKRAIRLAHEKDITVAAICAAPGILARAGLLLNKKATVYPSLKDELGESYRDEDVVYDAPFLTGRAAGVTTEFALKLIEIIKGKKASEKVAADICFKLK
ncbi:MAG: DJ-1/PfpI family protein [Ruminococcaceae bacterium]|nr:DJ-1/PfpI family protein [Oscillospiraceae bacterium]